jgi:hypothetical protein
MASAWPRRNAARLAQARQHVRQLLDAGHDNSSDGTTRLVHLARDIHALTAQHNIEARSAASFFTNIQFNLSCSTDY